MGASFMWHNLHTGIFLGNAAASQHRDPVGCPTACTTRHQSQFDEHHISWAPTPCKLISKYDDLLKCSKTQFEINCVGHKAPLNSQEIIPALVCVLGKFAQWSKSVIPAWENTHSFTNTPSFTNTHHFELAGLVTVPDILLTSITK